MSNALNSIGLLQLLKVSPKDQRFIIDQISEKVILRPRYRMSSTSIGYRENQDAPGYESIKKIVSGVNVDDTYRPEFWKPTRRSAF